MKTLLRWGRNFFVVWGILFFLLIAFAAIGIYNVQKMDAPPLPDKIVLSATLEGEIPEVIGTPDIMSPFFMPSSRLQDLITGLDQGRTDPNVQGFAIRLRPNSLSVAQIQELRQAVSRFRDSGKATYVFATAFGDFSNGMGAYYLASAFEHIWLQPVGNVSITGLAGQLPFFKDTLDKIGVTADMSARASYKTAVEPMTRNAPSPENDEMTRRLLKTIHGQMVYGMAEARKMSPADLQALINRAPLTAPQAFEAKLVDKIGYLDQMVDEIEGLDDSVELLDTSYYMASRNHHSRLKAWEEHMTEKYKRKDESTFSADTVAVIYASGAIVQGDTRNVSAPASPFGGSPVISAERLTDAIYSANENPRVGVILLRIDSPGGSATASETIARALERAQANGKPVIISMSGSAASGGYWIAAKADKIYAQPATMTGSIGVLGGKISISGLLDKLGVNVVTYTYGENAGLWSSTETFSASEQAKVDALLDHTYEAFLTRVSEGRDIPVETLRNQIAGGRVWTGTEAQKIGLVDEIGGLYEAQNFAKSMINPDHPDAVLMREYPARKSPLEMLADLLTNGVSMNGVVNGVYQYSALQLWQNIQQSAMMDAYANLPTLE